MKTESAPTIPAHLAQAFLRDMSARFAMPELAALSMRKAEGEHEVRRYGAEAFIAVASVLPTGQLASIVRSLDVVVVAYATEIDNLFQGEIKLSYQHHQGGSNGKDTRFIIAADAKFGDTCHEYLGAIEEGAFNRVRSHINWHQDKLKAKALKESSEQI